MMEMSSIETDVSQSQTGNCLMLSDAASSFAAGSARLQAKVRRFYDITPNPTNSAPLSDMNIITDSVSPGDMNTITDETATPPGLSNDTSTMVTVGETVENQQQSMLAGEGETAGIWLVYDGNMMPSYGDEITVYIHSDPMLLAIGMIVEVAGDANITTAMSEADCNNYGWDNGWNSDTYIDPAGWLLISGVSWEGVVDGTISYFKFRYNSGEVAFSINGESVAFDPNCEPVLFSGQPLIFGRDPNE
jgi:hypothetical protein